MKKWVYLFKEGNADMILCRSRKSAERTLENIVPYIEGRLFLKVNRTKTTVSHISKIKYLGYAFYRRQKKCRFRVHPKSIKKMKDNLRILLGRNNGMGNKVREQKQKQFATGWVNYYAMTLKSFDKQDYENIPANIAVFKVDKTGWRPLAVNTRLSRLLGLSAENLANILSERPEALFREEELNKVRLMLYKGGITGGMYSEMIQVLTADGSWRWIDLRLNAVPREDGTFIFNFIFMIDGYTDVAGGGSYRRKNGQRMRFKVLHKVFHFKKRTGFHMCVGCGRCDAICPEYISYSDCVNRLGDAMKEVADNE